MFLEASDYPFTRLLESRWQAIREECRALPPRKFRAWHEKWIYNHGWNVCGLFAFGERIEAGASFCPETSKILAQIPGLFTADFSSLRPGAHIKPHKGYSGSVLRCHLGLKVPGDCALKVAGETREWQEGRCLLFDDTSVHEAWNRSGEERIVLLLDFKKDAGDFSFPEKIRIGFLKILAKRYLS